MTTRTLTNPPAPAKGLNDAYVNALKPEAQIYRRSDGRGLYIEVTPTGLKNWRCVYWAGKTAAGKPRERQVTLGRFERSTQDHMTVQAARLAREQVREQNRKGDTVRVGIEGDRTFEACATEWHAKGAAHRWSPITAHQHQLHLVKWVFPRIGHKRIETITRKDIYDLLDTVRGEADDKVTKLDKGRRIGGRVTAHHVRVVLDLMFRDWFNRQEIPASPVGDWLLKDFGPHRKQRQPAATEITDARTVLATAEARKPSIMTLLLHRFAALTSVRIAEARAAKWAEIEGDTWAIPASHMKGRRGEKRPHWVYLSTQAQTVLAVLRRLQSEWPMASEYVFTLDGRSPVSRSAIPDLLDRTSKACGIKHVMHGWRAAMVTIMKRHYPGDHFVLQAMLAHVIGGVDGKYDRSDVRDHKDRARLIHQRWADLLLEDAPSPWTLAGLEEPAPANVVTLDEFRSAA
jgi:integrase